MTDTDQKPYRNAPIIEAALDIKVQPREGLIVEQLKQVYQEHLQADYVIIEDIKEGEFHISIEEGMPRASSSSKTVGFTIKSKDEKRIFQIKLDGLVSSRLAPYADWQDIEFESKRVWDLYSKHVSPVSVSRVALRYINRIDVPLETSFCDLCQYFNTVPHVAPRVTQGASPKFFMQLHVPLPELLGHAIISEGVGNQFREDKLSIILDIDVFVERNIERKNFSEIWDLLGSLRIEKNHIFESCITDKVRESLR